MITTTRFCAIHSVQTQTKPTKNHNEFIKYLTIGKVNNNKAWRVNKLIHLLVRYEESATFTFII